MAHLKQLEDVKKKSISKKSKSKSKKKQTINGDGISDLLNVSKGSGTFINTELPQGSADFQKESIEEIKEDIDDDRFL